MPSMRHEKILADVISRAVRFKIDAELTKDSGYGLKPSGVVYGLAAFAAASAFSKVVGGRGKGRVEAGEMSDEVVSVRREAAPDARRSGHIQALLDDATVIESRTDLDFDRFEREAKVYEARLAELRSTVEALTFERGQLEEKAGKAEQHYSKLSAKISLAEQELENLGRRKLELEEEGSRIRSELAELEQGQREHAKSVEQDEDLEVLREREAHLSHDYRRKESGVKYASATLASLENDRKALDASHQAVCSQLASLLAGGSDGERAQFEESKASLNDQLEQLDSEISKYQKLIDVENADLELLSKQREAVSSKRKRVEAGEIVALGSVDVHSSQESEELRQRLFEVEELLKISQVQAAEMTEISSSLRKKLDEAKAETNALQVQLDASISREEALKIEIEQLNDGLERYRSNEAQHQAEQADGRLELEKMTRRIEALEQQKKSLSDELAIYQSGASDLESKYGETKRRLDESTQREKTLEREMSELRLAITELEREKSGLMVDDQRLKESQSLMSTVQGERVQVEHELKEASAKVVDLQSLIAAKEATEREIVSKMDGVEERLAAQVREKTQVEAELSEARKSETDLRRQVQGLEATIGGLNAEVQRWKELKSQFEEVNSNSDALVQAEARLSAQLVEAKNLEASARGRVQELEEFSKGVEAQNADLRRMLDELNRESHELRAFKTQAEAEGGNASMEVSRLTADLSEQRTKEQSLAKEIAAIKEEVERRGLRIEELEQSEQRLVAQLEVSEKELANANQVTKDLESYLEGLRESYSKISSEKDHYAEKADKLEVTLNELKQQNVEREGEFGERLEELEHEIEVRDQQLKALLDDTRPSELTEVLPLAVPSSKKRFTKNFDVIPKPRAESVPSVEAREDDLAKVDKSASEEGDVFAKGLDEAVSDSEVETPEPFIAKKKLAGKIPEARAESGLGQEKSYSPDRSFDSLIEDSKRRKEEKVASNPEDQWKKEERPRKEDSSGAKWLALIGGGAVVGVGAAAAMLWLEMQDQNKPVDQTESTGENAGSNSKALGNGAAADPLGQPMNPLFGSEAEKQAKQSLTAFFNASSIEEKAAVARHPKRSLKHMETYYAKEPFEDLKVKNVEIIPKEEQLGGGSIGVRAVVKLEDASKSEIKVTMFFERLSDGRMLMDWETLFRFQSIPWEQYLNIRPQEAVDMHVLVGNGADEHPDISADDYFGVRVKGWDKDALRWTTAYIKRDHPKAEAFIDRVSTMSTKTDSYGSPAQETYYILKLRHTGDDSDPTRPLYIEDIVSDSFRFEEDLQAGDVKSPEDISYDDSSY